MNPLALPRPVAYLIAVTVIVLSMITLLTLPTVWPLTFLSLAAGVVGMRRFGQEEPR